MAHEKVYGICEDKCRVEVLPKGNFATLSFYLNFETHTEETKTQEFNLPDGFNIDNCFIVSRHTHCSVGANKYGYPIYSDFTESSADEKGKAELDYNSLTNKWSISITDAYKYHKVDLLFIKMG